MTNVIGLMTNVKYLLLDENSFTGSLPTEIGLMTNVKYLIGCHIVVD